MNIQKLFLAFTLFGSAWILYVLVMLSVFSMAVMAERTIFYSRRWKGAKKIREEAPTLIREGRWKDLEQLCREHNPGIGRALVAALERRADGRDAAAGSLAAERSREKLELERYLAYLGTLGNNAPFIGLFGTVLGIIKAFHDLSISQEAGPNVVMAGIAEALVATAVGLVVAIPAVVAYNYFQSTSRRLLTAIDDVAALLLAEIRPGKS